MGFQLIYFCASFLLTKLLPGVIIKISSRTCVCGAPFYHIADYLSIDKMHKKRGQKIVLFFSQLANLGKHLLLKSLQSHW
jgi:hypothetical protein